MPKKTLLQRGFTHLGHDSSLKGLKYKRALTFTNTVIHAQFAPSGYTLDFWMTVFSEALNQICGTNAAPKSANRYYGVAVNSRTQKQDNFPGIRGLSHSLCGTVGWIIKMCGFAMKEH